MLKFKNVTNVVNVVNIVAKVGLPWIHIISMLASNSPDVLTEIKTREVLKIRMDKKREQYLEVFIEYVENEITFNNDPLFHPETLAEFIV